MLKCRYISRADRLTTLKEQYMPIIIPDRIFESYKSITPEYLLSVGIRALILDIDNTLIPYEEDAPTEELYRWFAALKESGISVALVSNNNKKRLLVFNEKLGLPGYASSCKPLPHNLFRAMKEMKVKRKETAMVGDQLFTDMLAARFAGVRSYIVPPIRDKKKLTVRLKRKLEAPLVRRYYRKEAKKNG